MVASSRTRSRSGNEEKVLLLMGSVKVNVPEHLRLCDHDASSVGFQQPVLLRIAGEALNDELDRARVASIGHAIPYLNVLARLVGQRHESVQFPTDTARLRRDAPLSAPAKEPGQMIRRLAVSALGLCSQRSS